MSYNTITNLPNTIPSEITSQFQSCPPTQHANTTTVPLNVYHVTTIFPNEEEQHSPVTHKKKLKKKKSSKSASVKKTPKPKRGESKISLTMEDLYLKENSFNADSNVESSVKVSKAADVEASKDNPTPPSEKASDAAKETEVLEKGNPEKTLKSDDDKSVENSRVDDKHNDDGVACKNADATISNLAASTNISKTVEIPIEKHNVVPDAETSLGQQDDQNNIADDNVEPHAEAQDNHTSSNDEFLDTDKDKTTAIKSQEAVDDGERTV
jgi:hypothetical protein